MSRHWNFNIYIFLSYYKSSRKASVLCDKRRTTSFDPFRKKMFEVIFMLHGPGSSYDTRKKTLILFGEKERLIIR